MSDDRQRGISPVYLAAELTAAWLSNQSTRAHADDVPAFLRRMHDTVRELQVKSRPAATAQPETLEEHVPAVTVRRSLSSPEHIISMIDGKPYRSLKRHLTTHGLTPDQYRARYGLKPDYPMVAPAYSAARRDMATRIGLGRKRGVEAEVDVGADELIDALAFDDVEVVEVVEDDAASVEQDELEMASAEQDEPAEAAFSATEQDGDAAPQPRSRRKLKLRSPGEAG